MQCLGKQKYVSAVSVEHVSVLADKAGEAGVHRGVFGGRVRWHPWPLPWLLLHEPLGPRRDRCGLCSGSY